MQIQVLNFLTKNNIAFKLGQVKGGFETIQIEYKQRAELLEYIRKNRIKTRDINYSDDMTEVTLIFEKETKL